MNSQRYNLNVSEILGELQESHVWERIHDLKGISENCHSLCFHSFCLDWVWAELIIKFWWQRMISNSSLKSPLITFLGLKSRIFVSYLYKMNLITVKQWHHELNNLHIYKCINIPQNVLWKSVKLQNFITSLFFVQFASNFHHSAFNFSQFIEINLNLDGI